MKLKKTLVIIGLFCLFGIGLYATLQHTNFRIWFYQVRSKDIFAKKQISPLVQDHINTFINKYRVSKISIGITINGQTRFYNYGLTRSFPAHAITFQSPYEIASITKTFTALLAAYLDQQKVLNLSDPIARYLPNYAHSPIGKVNLLQLLTYSSSLPIYEKKSLTSRKLVLDDLKTWVPKPVIGSHRVYSNLGYGLIGEIIEKVTGHRYTDIMNRIILQPLNLSYSAFHHQYGFENLNTFHLPSSGLQSCTQDLIDYAQIMMHEKKTPLSLQQTIRETLKGYYKTPYFYQGLAWVLYPLPLNKKNLSHQNDEMLKVTTLESPKAFHGKVLAIKTGSDEDGYSSIIAIIPSKQLGVVLLSDQFIPSKERINFIYTVFNQLM